MAPSLSPATHRARVGTISAWEAGLAGIGAAFLTSAVLSAIPIELWFLRIWVTDGPPPRPPELLLLTWCAGAFVATRLGGSRGLGVLSLYALSAVLFQLTRLVINPLVDCALRPSSTCTTNVLELVSLASWIPEGLRGLLWLPAGLLLGVLAARFVRPTIPLRAGLVALSVFAIGIVAAGSVSFIAGYTVCFSNDRAQCFNAENLAWFGFHILLGLMAARVLVHSGGQAKDALVGGGLLLVAHQPGIVHQIVMIWGDGLPNVLGKLGPSTGVLAFMVRSLIMLRAQVARANA